MSKGKMSDYKQWQVVVATSEEQATMSSDEKWKDWDKWDTRSDWDKMLCSNVNIDIKVWR